MKKVTTYTPEEKLEIGRLLYEDKITKREAVDRYDIGFYATRDYMRMYRDTNHLPPKKNRTNSKPKKESVTMKNPFAKKDVVRRLPELELKKIPLENIKFAEYQREVKASKVSKIVKNFVPDVMGVALVSFRNGEFYCIDAQHRVEALKKLGYTEILCQVLTGLTYEQECYRFVLLNTGRTQLTANQVFHGRVEEKDEDAIALVSMFKKYRFEYNKNNGIKEDNVIGAVSKFVKIQKSLGMDRVEQVLRILRNAWYGDKYSLSSAIISGLSTFLSENPNADELALTKALEKVMPNVLIAQANNYVKCDMLRPGRADSACYHIAKEISYLYEDEISRSARGRKIKVAY